MTGAGMTCIKLSEIQKQLANIKIAEVTEGSIGRRLMFNGVLKVDEQSSVNISSRTAGRIEKLFFKTTGEKVKKGDALFEFYSEELWAAEREYIGLQKNNWNYSGRYEPSLASENKLLLMGLTPSQILQLKNDGKIFYTIKIYSAVDGIIRSVNITEGQYVTKGQQLFELADDKKLWLEAQAYPDELQFLNNGMPVDIIIPTAGDLHLQNHISYINPVFESGKNVTLIRAIIDNPGKMLHPGMLAMISVQTQLSHGIVIPSEAVINSKTGSIVWVMQNDGNFMVRKVTTGVQSADSVLVQEGLEKSEMIVTSGVYLLNSEMILNNGSETTDKIGI